MTDDHQQHATPDGSNHDGLAAVAIVILAAALIALLVSQII